MSVLHLINHPPTDHGSFARCLKTLAPGDAVLLIGDGVYAALHGVLAADERSTLAAVSNYVLQPDLEARALSERRLSQGFEPVDYMGFVDLIARYPTSVSWG